MSIKVNIKKCYHEAGSSKKSGAKKAFMLNVSFEMENELIVLFGPSGSGKTTLFKCISGITEPDGGNVTVDSKVYYDKEIKINLPIQKRNLGYVFQSSTLFPHMDVRKNIECGLKNWNKESREKRVMEMLSLLHIEELEKRYPSQLSGGQKQRVALARALAPEPELLLLDEPFSALDKEIKTELIEKIKSLQHELKIPLLFITHNLEEVFMLADRVLVLHGGKVQQFGTLDEIFYHPKNLHVAKLIGLSNLFDDARVVGHDELFRSTILMSGDMKIRVPSLKLNPGDMVSWGVHPENITFLPPGHEDQDKNIYMAHVVSIINKGPKKKIIVNLTKHHKTLTAEVPAQFVDSLKLNARDSCLVKLEISNIVTF